ncbi:MAG: hypothetical protein ACI9CB_001955 [Rhodothermales bacterium]|jgi:hypothetical protein
MKNVQAIICEGSCHCGHIKIAVKVPLNAKVARCNCSICTMSGYLHLFVEKHDLEVLQGEEKLTDYRFNTGVARHLFCSVCGIKTFYVPRSHPEGFSVNLRCLVLDEKIQISIKDFDGQHWNKNIDGLLLQD